MSASGSEIVFDVKTNSRYMTEISVKGRHVSVEDLKERIQKDPTLWNKILGLGRNPVKIKSKQYGDKPKILDYLLDDIPKYPTPVEFRISTVSHVTEKGAIRSILRSQKIQPPCSKYSYWSLYINEEEIKSAEERYLQQNSMTSVQPILEKFCNSPAFKQESRYGNYRLTFPLSELMELYREQFCGGEEPVLRVMKTVFYQQEIMYTVLIHSPQSSKKFRKLPLLEESEFVRYQNGEIIWKAQAISNDLQFELLTNTDEGTLEVNEDPDVKYVWDHVALAFHLDESSEGLKIPRQRLIEALDACKVSEKNLVKQEDDREELFERAQKVVAGSKRELHQ